LLARVVSWLVIGLDDVVFNVEVDTADEHPGMAIIGL